MNGSISLVSCSKSAFASGPSGVTRSIPRSRISSKWIIKFPYQLRRNSGRLKNLYRRVGVVENGISTNASTQRSNARHTQDSLAGENPQMVVDLTDARDSLGCDSNSVPFLFVVDDTPKIDSTVVNGYVDRRARLTEAMDP